MGAVKPFSPTLYPAQGIDEKRFSIDDIVEYCKGLGYSRVILRPDDEKPIAKLVCEALKGLRITCEIDQAMREGRVPYDPQSNGDAEAGVRMVKGSLRTLQLCIERRLGVRIPVGHPILAWLVGHAADVRNYRIRDHTGKSPYHIVKGRPFASRLLGFGENCLFKRRSKEPLTDGGHAYRWSEGIS